MGIRSILSKPLARWVVKKQNYWSERPVETQNKVFRYLLSSAQKTAFGLDHHFESIHSHEDYCRLVPIREYEGFVNYIEEVKSGQKDILWPGIPLYFAKTSYHIRYKIYTYYKRFYYTSHQWGKGCFVKLCL